MSGITWGKGHNKSKGSPAVAPWPNGTKRMSAVDQAIAALARENARRVKCGQCDLMILPENMERHVRICHEW